jgi:endonuclease-3 related protein
MNRIKRIFDFLFSEYGCQGWWPLLELQNHKKINITKSGSIKGYHPGNYSFPKNEEQRFEICLGAILTQNTSWTLVEKALINLSTHNCFSINEIKQKGKEILKELIRPAGYFNQKADYIFSFIEFFENLNNRIPLREELLAVKGIGNETADSILLYGFKQAEFVVDAYSIRILLNLGLIKEKASYLEIKDLFEKNLDKDYKLFQEYHALLVEHAKRYYNRKPYGKGDILLEIQ